jgi:hypothetical protein
MCTEISSGDLVEIKNEQHPNYGCVMMVKHILQDMEDDKNIYLYLIDFCKQKDTATGLVLLNSVEFLPRDKVKINIDGSFSLVEPNFK